MIKPKKATSTVNNTLSESMYTPASIPAIQATDKLVACQDPKKTSGTSESAKPAVTVAIAKTKTFRALELYFPINGMNKLEISGNSQTSQAERGDRSIMVPLLQQRFVWQQLSLLCRLSRIFWTL